MNKQQLIKKAEWIIEEAQGYLRDWDCCLTMYKNFQDYVDNMWDWNDEEYIQDKKEELESELNIDLPFFIVEKIGTDLMEYYSVEDVKRHTDLFEYFEGKYELWERNRNSKLVYVSSENYNTFKNIIKSEFSGEFSKSPYSTSAYNSTDIGWNHKPDGSLRVADHWNFESRDEIHCQTDVDIDEELAIGRYNGETKKYDIFFSDYCYAYDVIPVKVTENGLEFLEDLEVLENVA